ncbi:MAG: hypothetical protein AUH85_14815 [Chloroflexi bacterium 13_1_40CM_4_68_4]|nr:MAG: hypothetical protein AUH85_14815 [Chloroflexi bacterium 13_1_40CM_4_68_4]
MPRTVGRDEVRALASAGAQIVDVLPAEDYEHEHIAGAISLPLKELTAERVRALLDPKRPVVVYCYDPT